MEPSLNFPEHECKAYNNGKAEKKLNEDQKSCSVSKDWIIIPENWDEG